MMIYDVILSQKENQYFARVKEWPEIMAYDKKRDEAIRQVQTQLFDWLTRQKVEVVQIEVPLPKTTKNPYTAQLALRQGVAGSDLLAFAGCIEPSELQKMSQAIEEDCAKVDLNEW